MHGMLTPVCIHPRIQTGNRAHSRTSGISSACQAIKPMSSPASVPHSKRAAPKSNTNWVIVRGSVPRHQGVTPVHPAGPGLAVTAVAESDTGAGVVLGCSVESFEDDGHALAAADAHGFQSEGGVAFAEPVEQGGGAVSYTHLTL